MFGMMRSVHYKMWYVLNLSTVILYMAVDKNRPTEFRANMTTPNLQQSCAKSWGLPLNHAAKCAVEVLSVAPIKTEPKNTQNHSKNNALNSIAFASDLTIRFDSEIQSETQGEQAHV
jgi:hypothetical protein